jgi:hypothetical protein
MNVEKKRSKVISQHKTLFFFDLSFSTDKNERREIKTENFALCRLLSRRPLLHSHSLSLSSNHSALKEIDKRTYHTPKKSSTSSHQAK